MEASSLNRENIFQRVHVTFSAVDDILGSPMKSLVYLLLSCFCLILMMIIFNQGQSQNKQGYGS